MKCTGLLYSYSLKEVCESCTDDSRGYLECSSLHIPFVLLMLNPEFSTSEKQAAGEAMSKKAFCVIETFI